MIIFIIIIVVAVIFTGIFFEANGHGTILYSDKTVATIKEAIHSNRLHIDIHISPLLLLVVKDNLLMIQCVDIVFAGNVLAPLRISHT